MANTIFRNTVPPLKAIDNGDGTYSMAISVLSGDAIGALGASAWVIASNAGAEIKAFAAILRTAGYPVWVCDGTNDEVQIQAAIDSLTSYGGTVSLSAGIFYIGAAIKWFHPSANVTVNIVGQGMYATTLQQAANCNIFEHLVGDGKQGILSVLRALRIFGVKGTYTGSGVYVTETVNAKDYRFVRVFIDNFSAYGIYTGEGWGWQVVQSVIENCGTAGFHIYNTSNGPLIAYCKFLLNAVGIQLFNTGGARIIGNEIGTATTIGIDSDSQGDSLRSNVVSSNWIRNNPTGIRLYKRQENWNINNNILDDNADYGILLTDATAVLPQKNNLIENNQIYGSTSSIYNQYPSLTDRVYNNLIAGNRCDVLPNISPSNRSSKQTVDIFMDVLAVSATHIRSNEDLSAGIPITFTLDAQPDIPRTLSGHFDSHAQITAYTIAIVGVDARGNTITETLTEVDGWDWETNNAFATITSITMSARTGTGVGDTMDIGITDVLGLSDVFYATGDVYKIKKNNANAVVAGAQVSTTYRTYDMAVIGLAGADDFTIWFRSNLNIIS